VLTYFEQKLAVTCGHFSFPKCLLFPIGFCLYVNNVVVPFNSEWKSDQRHRSKAMPHIKTYARVSPCGRHLAWFHLTSANLSKAAWGKLQQPKRSGGGPGLYVMSYEAGVLFAPKLLVSSTSMECSVAWDRAVWHFMSRLIGRLWTIAVFFGCVLFVKCN
jgi:hypothetical protein